MSFDTHSAVSSTSASGSVAAPATAAPLLTRKDFASDQQVKWCPGCGDYTILNTLQGVMAKLGHRREHYAIISGIGCSSRFPYYMNTYGFHTIHGRATAVATGVKAASPKLQVWVITGDGDGLSIGGNHMLHVLRRNVDVKIVLFNNQIYGLTKGQFSPTSAMGLKTKTSPMGNIDVPLQPVSVALAAGAGFVARTADNDVKHLAQVFEAAAAYKGAAFIEVLQNCVIFNDKVHEPYYGRDTRDDNLLYLEHGKPLLYGKEESRKAFASNGFGLAPVSVSDGNASGLVVHDEQEPTGALAYSLSRFHFPEWPVPLGVFRNVGRPAYHELMDGQIEAAVAKKGTGDLDALLHSGITWKV